MSPATFGGIFLIVGAFFTYTGNVKRAILSYFVADVAWVLIAFSTGDITGMCFVLIGMILGIGVLIKMRKNIFRETLNN